MKIRTIPNIFFAAMLTFSVAGCNGSSGGSVSAYDTYFHGLYLGNLTCTGGSLVGSTTFTASGLEKLGGASYF